VKKKKENVIIKMVRTNGTCFEENDDIISFISENYQ
jgi:hypothetical protein